VCIIIIFFILYFVLCLFSFSSTILIDRKLDVYHASTRCGLNVNLEFRSEMWCTRLAENTECKKSPKIRHLGTTAQLCRAISSHLRHLSTIGKTHSLAISPSHVLTISWTRLRSVPEFGAPWQIATGLSSWLGSVTAWHSSSGRQPNFAALNRGHHLYSAGRPSRWALAHILVVYYFPDFWLKFNFQYWCLVGTVNLYLFITSANIWAEWSPVFVTLSVC